MGLLTFFLFAAGAGLVGFCLLYQRRPRRSFDAPLVPTTPLLFLGIVLLILSLASGLAAVGTDLPARGRF